MEVVVDGRFGLMAPDTGTTFRDLFESLRRSAATRRRVVVSFTLDGEIVNAEKEGALYNQAPGAYALLEVRTIDPFETAQSTLAGLSSHLRNLERIHEEAAACAASGEYTKALEKFDACFNGWDILLRVVRDVASLSSADFKSLRAQGETVDVRLRELQDSLLRFSAALEFKDVMRISEIVQGELKTSLVRWKGILEALGQHIARLSGVSAPRPS
jgi:hypothetical protein